MSWASGILGTTWSLSRASSSGAGGGSLSVPFCCVGLLIECGVCFANEADDLRDDGYQSPKEVNQKSERDIVKTLLKCDTLIMKASTKLRQLEVKMKSMCQNKTQGYAGGDPTSAFERFEPLQTCKLPCHVVILICYCNVTHWKAKQSTLLVPCHHRVLLLENPILQVLQGVQFLPSYFSWRLGTESTEKDLTLASGIRTEYALLCTVQIGQQRKEPEGVVSNTRSSNGSWQDMIPKENSLH